MEKQIYPENTGEIQGLRNDRGQYIKGVSGNPSGKPYGAKNRFSPITKIQEIWENNPEEFNDFINKYLRDPKNRQHIVEMVDGKPKRMDNGQNPAFQQNIYNFTPEDEELIDQECVRRTKELIAEGKVCQNDL